MVAAAAAGDDGAAESLYRLHEAMVRRVVARIVPPDLIDDIAQETWLRVFRSLTGFRGDCAFSSWIYRIARNVALSAVRRSAAALEQGDGTDVELGPPVPAADVPLRIDLTRGLAELPDGMRTVLWLHDVEGWTHAEIGDRLGIAAGTSKSQLFKARAKLRRAIAPRELAESAA